MWVCVCVYSNVIDYIKLYGDRSVSHGITMASANQTVRVSGCGRCGTIATSTTTPTSSLWARSTDCHLDGFLFSIN